MKKKHYFLSGHGTWEPKNGYTKLPKGCTIHFYSHFAKTISTKFSRMIMRGDYDTKELSIGEYKMCPNLELSVQNIKWNLLDQKALEKRSNKEECLLYFISDKILLDQIFANIENKGGLSETEIEFHWMACYKLAITGSQLGDFGVNVQDDGWVKDKAKRFSRWIGYEEAFPDSNNPNDFRMKRKIKYYPY